MRLFIKNTRNSVHWVAKLKLTLKPKLKLKVKVNVKLKSSLRLALMSSLRLALIMMLSFSYGEVRASPMKVLSYNVWHSLNGRPSVLMKKLEPESRIQQRQDLQTKNFKAFDPGLMFLQELNPVRSRALQISRSLNLSEVHQSDNCGVKVFGFGIPSILNSGIAILAKKSWGLTKIGGYKLSGSGLSLCNDWIGFQLSELRYGLLAELSHPALGLLLIVNTHLHHGPSWSLPLERALKLLASEATLTTAQRIKLESRLRAAEQRRLEELQVLTRQINIQYSKKIYQGIILAGDFNMDSGSLEYRFLMDQGYIDAWSIDKQSKGPLHDEFTWNSVTNEANHRFGKKFYYPISFDGLGLEKKALKRVLTVLKQATPSRRRIDYIFVSPSLKDHMTPTQLFGDKPDATSGLMGSDHYGVSTYFNESIAQ